MAPTPHITPTGRALARVIGTLGSATAKELAELKLCKGTTLNTTLMKLLADGYLRAEQESTGREGRPPYRYFRTGICIPPGPETTNRGRHTNGGPQPVAVAAFDPPAVSLTLAGLCEQLRGAP